jgi:hypothetical protein
MDSYLDFFIRSRVMCKLVVYFANNTQAIHMRGVSYSINEDSSAVHNKLKILEQKGIIVSEKRNNRRFYRTNPACPVLEQVRHIAKAKIPGGTMKSKYYLTDEECTGLVKLINEEIELNRANGDEAYNTFWENIKMALGYAIVK